MLLFVRCYLIVFLFGIMMVDGASLYSDSPYVMEVAAYPPLGKCPWYCVMYVSWCGHCQQFAPGYKKFAQSIQNDTFGTVVAALDCVRYETHCQALNITEYPTLVYYDGDRPHRLKALHHDFSTRMPIPAIAHDELAHKECIRQKNRRLKAVQVRANSTHSPTWYNAYLSFQYSIKHEVPDSVKKDALLNTSNMKGVYVTKDVLAYRDFMKHAYLALPQLRSPKGPVGDKDCSYTCGLWRLYHSMVEGPEPVAALKAISSYVVTFFQCLECRHHFSELTASIERTVWDAPSARLWLWKAHNKINTRLSHPFFPSREDCATCATDDDVLLFLHKRYAALPRKESTKQDRVLVYKRDDVSATRITVDPIVAVLMLLLLFVLALIVGCGCSRREIRKGPLSLPMLSRKDHVS